MRGASRAFALERVAGRGDEPAVRRARADWSFTVVEACRIGLETGPLSVWLWNELRQAFQEWLMMKLSFLQPLLDLPPNFLEVLAEAATNLINLFLEALPEATRAFVAAARGLEPAARVLDRELAPAAFRIFQEALTNIVRPASASSWFSRLRDPAA